MNNQMKSQIKKIKLILIIFAFLLSIFILTSCKEVEEQKASEYKLIYKSEGSGYIVCDYETNSRIETGTEVSLSAISNDGYEFQGWYDENSSELSKDSTITIIINKKYILTAKFKASEEIIDPIPVEDPYTKISSLEAGKEAKVKATVLVTFKTGFIIKDSTGYALVYLNETFDYTCGDVIEFTTIPTLYNDKIEITELNDCKRVGYELISLNSDVVNENDILKYQNNETFGAYVQFSGKVVKIGSYYDIQIGESTNYIYPYNYDENTFHLSNIVGENATFKGYIWGRSSSNNVYLILESVELDSSIIDDGDKKIIAYFNSDWKNPTITLNNSKTYNMTLVDDHYEYTPTTSISTVVFKSGEMKTETLDFDEDSYTFVLGNIRYNGLYDGYFTDYENAFNEVTKITTLQLNDLHGYVEQENGMNGISNASYLINQIRNEDDRDNVVLVANGDIFQGTAFSNLTRGKSVVEIMNAMDFDFMGIGNHEFDWGIDEIFRFFDGDDSNGEANFPLINSNIYFTSSNKLVTYDGYNILETLMIEKDGLKIGVVSCIGMLKSSILASRTEGYDFKNIVSTATPLCKALRDSGADIIIANLHDGSTNTVSDYTNNVSLANITYKGKNLVDIIINGHTHYNQFGYVERDGADVPVTQASCNCKYLGELCVYYDNVLGEVVYSHVRTYDLKSTVGTNYDENIQKIVDEKYNEVKDQIEETYCKAGETIKQKNQIYNWASQVMLTCVGADCAISNTGGIRSTGGIEDGNDIQLKNMFEIIPFDNEIIICEVSGANLKAYLQTTSNYYGLKDNIDVTDLASSKTYKVAVIDYVYYGSYFVINNNPINTHVIYRDALIEDLKLRTTFSVSTDKTAVVGMLYNN